MAKRSRPCEGGCDRIVAGALRCPRCRGVERPCGGGCGRVLRDGLRACVHCRRAWRCTICHAALSERVAYCDDCNRLFDNMRRARANDCKMDHPELAQRLARYTRTLESGRRIFETGVYVHAARQDGDPRD